jgi:hypothetical protein
MNSKIAGLGSIKRVTERVFKIIQENNQKMLCACVPLTSACSTCQREKV